MRMLKVCYISVYMKYKIYTKSRPEHMNSIECYCKQNVFSLYDHSFFSTFSKP
jgi:hypothetical protein